MRLSCKRDAEVVKPYCTMLRLFLAGEASSNTFTSANGIYLRGFKGDTPIAQWAQAAGSNATLPALLREAQPYLRLILMLRNPVTR